MGFTAVFIFSLARLPILNKIISNTIQLLQFDYKTGLTLDIDSNRYILL